MNDNWKEVPEDELQELFDKACERGAVLALFHFDAHGKTEEGIKTSLVELLSRASKEKGILYCTGEIEPAMERNGLYSSTVEAKILGEDLEALLLLAMRYGPIAIEVVQPKTMKLNADEMQGILVDASQITQQFSEYILKNSLKGEALDDVNKRINARVELGKQIVEKKQLPTENK